MRFVIFAALLALFSGSSLLAQDTQDGYRKPPPEVLSVLHAPAPPAAALSPTRDTLLLLEMERYPPIADLAQPLLRLAGLRIKPELRARGSVGNSDWRPYATAMTVKRIADGAERPVPLPAQARVAFLDWSADGTRFAFSNIAADGIELWVCEAATGEARRIAGVHLNDVLGYEAQFLPDHKTLLIKQVVDGKAAPPSAPPVPRGPNIQETAGKAASSTYEARDVLKTPYDEDLFEYFATSQLALVDTTTGKVQPIAAPAMYRLAEVSPDGQHLLIERLQRTFTRLFTENRFPVDVEIADLSGKTQHSVAHQPLADQVPIEGARTGPRSYGWRPTEPATLVWVEALDGGDPKAQAPYRDRVLTLAAPFTQAPVELFKMEQRFSGIQWNRKGEPALVHDYDPDRRWRRTFAFDADQTPASLRLIWDLSASERYKDPGSPLMTQLPTGHAVMLDIDGCIYLSGSGASQEGDRPFLDRLNLRTLEAQRLFRCDRTSFETVLTMLDAAGKQIITRRETPSEPPNFMVRTLGDAIQNAPAGEAQLASSLRPVTTFPDPTPQLRANAQQLVT